MNPTAVTEWDSVERNPVMNLVPSQEEAMLRETVSKIASSFGHEYFVKTVSYTHLRAHET